MRSLGWVALPLVFGGCGGAKRAAPSPASPPAASAASPMGATDSVYMHPFQADSTTASPWGFRRADGSVAIAPRFAYAGLFREGLARVYDDSGRWGYVDSSGAFIIPARFQGAGDFSHGEAPIQDSKGFALIDRTGRVVDRIREDSAVAAEGSVPPPSDTCSSVESYLNELGRGTPSRGGSLDVNPREGESRFSAVALRLRHGVVIIEGHGYESFSQRALLPGVSADEARKWLLNIRRGRPLEPGDSEEGCEEHWESGAVPGGAFIAHHGGC